jgi:hypothetical protein
MDIGEQLDESLRHFREGKPDAPPNDRTCRVAMLVQTALALLGDDYMSSNAWDVWPQSCHIHYHIGKRDGDGWWYRLGCLSYRDLHYRTDAALIANLCQRIPEMFAPEPPGTVTPKSEDRGCL